MRACQIVWGLLLLIAASGCGEPRCEVSKFVSIDDGKRAIQRTAVIFTTEDGKSSGLAVINDDGIFSDVSFSEPSEGLPPGTYKITFCPPDERALPPDVAAKAPPNFGIARKYMSSSTSDLPPLEVNQDIRDDEIRLDPVAGGGHPRVPAEFSH